MSRREKKTVLYSRNGIKIERTDYIDISKSDNLRHHGLCSRTMVSSVIDNKKTKVIKGKPAWEEVIKKESPLGFYYKKTIRHSKTEDRVIQDTATFVKYTAKYGTSRYDFIYPYSYGNVSLSNESRPWDLLPGYKGIPEHFITDLHREIVKMFDTLENEKVRRLVKDRSYDIWDGWKDAEILDNKSWIYEERQKIFQDVFGNPNGPTVTYDNIKIVSHGFDLKESFRKRKEE